MEGKRYFDYLFIMFSLGALFEHSYMQILMFLKLKNMSFNYNGSFDGGYHRIVLSILVDFGKAICTLGHPFPHKFVFCFPR